MIVKLVVSSVVGELPLHSAGALEDNCILGVANDFTDELVQLFRKCCG